VRERPDLSITDLSLPGAGGLDVLRRMRAREPDARVLVFSMHDSPHLVQRALHEARRALSASWPSPTACWPRCGRCARAGATSPGLDRGLLQQPCRPAAADALLATLSAREFSVFRLLAEGHSAAACAERLKLSPKTVANVQTVVKEKLQVDTTAALVAPRHGLLNAPPGARHGKFSLGPRCPLHYAEPIPPAPCPPLPAGAPRTTESAR
jgi:DNA-binding NarL/FixJ family response regulator